MALTGRIYVVNNRVNLTIYAAVAYVVFKIHVFPTKKISYYHIYITIVLQIMNKN